MREKGLFNGELSGGGRSDIHDLQETVKALLKPNVQYEEWQSNLRFQHSEQTDSERHTHNSFSRRPYDPAPDKNPCERREGRKTR